MFLLPLATEIPLPTSAGHASAPHLDEDGRCERTFHTWPRAGTRLLGGRPDPGSAGLSCRCTSRSCCYWHAGYSCVSEWGCHSASGSAGERTANACVGRYPIARDSRAVFRCFSSCWAGSWGRARDWMSPAANYSSCRPARPTLVWACVDTILTMLMLMLMLTMLILHPRCGSDSAKVRPDCSQFHCVHVCRTAGLANPVGDGPCSVPGRMWITGSAGDFV